MYFHKNFGEFFILRSDIKKYVKGWIHILLLALCTFASTHAENIAPIYYRNKTVRFHHYSTLDGLASDKILNILQDQYDFMWFATENGLTRFDGIHFENYFHSEKDTTSLSDNIVTALAEDIYGNLWVGTHNGLNCYDRIHNQFSRYNSAKGELKNDMIRALHADKKGNLWIETAQGYLTQHKIKDKYWTHFKHNPGVAEGNHYYWHIYEDSLQNLWIGGRTLQGILFSKNSHKMTSVPTWSDKGMALESAFFVQTEDGNLFSSSLGSIQKYDVAQQKFMHYCPIQFEATCAVANHTGEIWIGGYGGLVKWNYPANKFEVFYPDSNNPNAISSNQVHCIYAAKDECIWIGTDNGINLYSPRQNLFQTYRHYNVSALMEDKDLSLWIGTQDSGCYVFDKERGKISHFNYQLMTSNIDYATFQREKEVIRQYIRHEAIYNDQYTLSENLADDFSAYKKADLHFKYPNENHVSALYQDKEGIIYVGLWNHVGFNAYNPATNQWKRYALWSKKPDYHYPRLWLGNPFGANWYNGFLEDKKGRFWCATWECFGLNLFNREEGRFESKHYFPNNVPCFPQGKIEQIYYDKARERYILNGKNTYFGYYDNKEKRFYKFGEHFPKDYTNLDIVKGYYQYSKAKVFTLPNEFGCDYILPDGNNRLYMANTHKIMYMDLTNHTTHHVLSMPANNTFAWTLSNNKKSLIIYCDRGFITIDTHTLACTKLKLENISLNLKTNDIRVLLQSQNNELWLGTSTGLWKYSEHNGWKQLLPQTQSINIISELNNHYIYVGSNKGLYIFHKNQQIKYIPFQSISPEGLPGTEVRAVYMSDSHNCWIATNDGLVQLVNDKITIFEHSNNDPHSLIDNNVCAISDGPEHKLWIATYQGLCLFDPNTKSFTDMTQPGNDCLTSRLTSCITEDKQGNIWIGTTEKGINVLDINTDTITHYYHQPWDIYSLPDNYVECIFCSQNGNMWIGTHQGLAKYNKESQKFQSINQTENLHIKGIQEDKQNFLWITTNKGLLLTDSTGTILRRFYDYHGLPNNNLSRAICQLKDGKVCVGSNYGFSIFEPKLLRNSQCSRKIVLTDLQVNSSPFAIDLNKEKKLRLKSEQNSFTIGFAAANYDFSQHLKYRYKLIPFDKKWNYTAPPLLSAKYTNLKFGKYSLIIEASNEFGEWNGQTLTLSIQIATPWYYSWWFITMLIGLSILSIWGFIRFREKQLRKENEQLEALVKERTEKLYQIMENKNKFFNIVSHDLKSPLNHLNVLSTALLEEYDDLDDKEKLQKIRMICKSSHQGKSLLDNLQLWVLSQKEIIKPVFRETNLTDEIEAVVQLLNPNIEKKELTIITPSQPIIVYTDKNMLSTILRNLIANAIKYSYRKGYIHITVEDNKDYWYVNIKDNGVGISAERIKKLFQIGTKVSSLGTEKEEGTGLGLLIVREFINRLGESIQVKSTKGEGSIFTFTLHKTLRK